MWVISQHNTLTLPRSISEMKAVAMEINLQLKADKYYNVVRWIIFDVFSLPYLSWEQWLKWVLTKSFWDIVSRKTTLTTTPVTLSLPPIFLLLRLLILQNENRQIAIRRMCRHATGDAAADGGRRIEYFHKQFLKCQILADFTQLWLISICFVRRLNQASFQPPLCVLWHMPPINTTFLLIPVHHLPSCRITRLFLILSGKWNHNNTGVNTFPDIFKAEQRILEPERVAGGDTVRLCVRRKVEKQQTRTEGVFAVAFAAGLAVSVWSIAA